MHDLTQVVVGWTVSHLCEFVIGERLCGESLPDDDYWDRHVYKAAGIGPKTLIERDVDCFLYAYDFGDDWRHDIFLESLRDGEADSEYAAFVHGERRCAPEDVGGVPGVMQFLKTALDALDEQDNDIVRGHRKPFHPGDIAERWCIFEALDAGCAPLGRLHTASTRKESRFDPTCGLRLVVDDR